MADSLTAPRWFRRGPGCRCWHGNGCGGLHARCLPFLVGGESDGDEEWPNPNSPLPAPGRAEDDDDVFEDVKEEVPDTSQGIEDLLGEILMTADHSSHPPVAQFQSGTLDEVILPPPFTIASTPTSDKESLLVREPEDGRSVSIYNEVNCHCGPGVDDWKSVLISNGAAIIMLLIGAKMPSETLTLLRQNPTAEPETLLTNWAEGDVQEDNSNLFEGIDWFFFFQACPDRNTGVLYYDRTPCADEKRVNPEIRTTE